MNLTYGSMCSGIEAPGVAWTPLGWQPRFFAETDPDCCKVLAARYPGVPNYGDIERIDGKELPAVDVLVAGTPCQSFSVAGRRGGLLDDPRGNLTLEFFRVVGQMRQQSQSPTWLVWENVPGVCSSWSDAETDSEGRIWQRNDFDTVLELVEQLGFGWSYRICDAEYYGVAQRRRRVFVVGYAGVVGRPGNAGAICDPERLSLVSAAVLFERESLSGHPAPGRETRQGAAASAGDGAAADCDERAGITPELAGTLGGASQEGGFRTTDLDNVGAFVECATPVTATDGGYRPEMNVVGAVSAKWAKQAGGPAGDEAYNLVIADPLSASDAKKFDDGSKSGVHNLVVQSTGHGYWNDRDVGAPVRVEKGRTETSLVVEATPILEAGVRTGREGHEDVDGLGVGEPGDPMYSLQAAHQHGVAVAFKPSHYTRSKDGAPSDAVPLSADADKGDQDAIVFESRFARNGRGAPDDIAPPLKAQSGQTGKGDAAPLLAFSFKDDGQGASEDLSPTMRALDFDESHANGGSHLAASVAGTVRRLTPTECARLQAFPDSFLDGLGLSDSAKYRMLGNSMCTNVVRWIGQRIALVEKIIRNPEVQET